MDGAIPSSAQLAASVAETLRGLSLLVSLLVLVVGIVATVVWDWFLSREKSGRVSVIALIVCHISFLLFIRFWKESPPSSQLMEVGWRMLIFDPFALFFSIFILISTLTVVGMSGGAGELRGRRMGEYYALLLTASLAACLLVASTNLLLLYLAFETLSLSSYALAGYAKDRRESVEASLKYVLFGAVASGVMLYGLSLLYGMAGSLELREVVRSGVQNRFCFLLVVALILAGFGFKMSLVPFHFWAPDVYQGAPTPITAYLSVVSKAAGFAVFMRFFAPLTGAQFAWESQQLDVPWAIRFDFLSLLWVIAVLTMTLGNFVALKQNNFKRLLAYSSIAHAGYMAAALVAGNHFAYWAILFYFVVYAVANIGLFFAAQLLNDSKGSAEIRAFRGLVYESPTVVAAVAVLLWSLIGLPPTGGFMGKFFLFSALIKEGVESKIPSFYYALVLVAVANSVVSLYYYIAVIREMAFYKAPDDLPRFKASKLAKGSLVVAALFLLAVQINWSPLSSLSNTAVGAPNAPSTPTVSGAAAVANTPSDSSGIVTQ
jgi:NADH-quinone oxidoreductase subunit N